MSEERVIRVRALGASEIRIGRKTITPTAEVVFALALYLCVRAGERLAREEVCEVFWGEGREPQGRHSLRQMLYRLRQKGLTLDEEEEELYLDPKRVESDLAKALEEGWPADAEPAEIDLAAALVPGFTRGISARYQEWLDGVRGRLAAQHRRAALRQVAQARREGRWADLDRWALQVLRSDPLNEEATLARAESAAISGSKAVALEIIDSYMEELGDRASVIGLPASLLRRRIAERRPEWSGRGPREVPLVGRRELMARLTASVDAASAGQGSSVLLWGAPGIGKTRLAEEVCAYAQLEGFRVLSVRGPMGGSSRPISLLFALVPMLRNLPGSLGCDPASIAILDQVLPLGEARVVASSPIANSSLHDGLLASLRDLLDAITSECRVLILVDDLHNVDSSSFDVLSELGAESRQQRLLWLMTSRVRPSDLPHANGKFSVASLYVPPLAQHESEDLAQALALKPLAGRARVAPTQVAVAAGGNPLFVRELSTHPSAEYLSGNLPSTLRALIADRLAVLSGTSIRLLRLSALLGGLASVSRLRELNAHAMILADELEQLENLGIIHLNASHAVTLHECWHHGIVESLPRSVHASLADECARLLSAEAPRSLEATWRAAMLYSECGEKARALALYLECGEETLRRGLPEEAVAVANAAGGLATSSDELIPLLSLRARAESGRGNIAEVYEISTRGVELARSAPNRHLGDYVTLTALHVDSLIKTHREHRPELAHLASLVQNENVPHEAQQYACLIGIGLAFTDSRSPLEHTFAVEARRGMEVHGETMYGRMAELIEAAELGRVSRVRALDVALARLENEPLAVGLRCRALFIRAAARRLIGDSEGSSELATRAYDIAAKHKLYSDALRTCDLMMFASLDNANYSEVDRWISLRGSLSDAPSHAFGNDALHHVQARIHLQQGNYAPAMQMYAERGALIAVDPLETRRGVETATLSLCFAGSGRASESRRELLALDGILERNRASIQSDYIVEMALRSFTLLGDGAAADVLGRMYAARRASEYPAPCAPAYTALLPFLWPTTGIPSEA